MTDKGRRFIPSERDRAKGARLRSARLKKKLSQKHVADAAETSVSNISAYECANTYLTDERLEELLAIIAKLPSRERMGPPPPAPGIRKTWGVRVEAEADFDLIYNLTPQQRGRACARAKPPKHSGRGAGGFQRAVEMLVATSEDEARVNNLTQLERGAALVKAARCRV